MKSRFINIWDYKNSDFPFQIFIGGRGTGKTYSALKGALLNKNKFLFMRRTAQELELMLDSDQRGEGANPFKPINNDINTNVGMRQIVKNMAGIYNRAVNDEGSLECAGAPIGYGVALSTISTIRGVDFSDCTDMIYDEFIPEKHTRKIKGEGEALFNAYETVNRNREFDGRHKPLNLWMLSNSNDIYNPVFIELGIVNIVEKMLKEGKSDRYLGYKGLAIHLINNNEDFVSEKKKTALYKLTEGTRFYDMALNNSFAYNDFSLIGYKPIAGYTPVCAVGEAYIYRKKGANELYVTYAIAKCPQYDPNKEQERRQFMADYGINIYNYFRKSLITFETYDLKAQILDIIL